MTIKLKLVLTAIMFAVIFVPLAYFTEFTGNFSKNAFTRFEEVGELRTGGKELGLLVRTYMTNFDAAAPENIIKKISELEKHSQKAVGLFRSGKSKAMAEDIYKVLLVYKENINSRLQILQKYKFAIYTDSFKNTGDGIRLATLSKEGSELNDKLDTSIHELFERFRSRNHADLHAYVLYSEIGMISGFFLFMGLLLFIAKDLTRNIHQARDHIIKIAQNRALNERLDDKRKDEIGEINSVINELLHSFGTAVGEVKKTSDENASVANELSQTSLEIGKRAEEQSSKVNNTMKSVVQINKQLEASVESSDSANKRAVESSAKLADASHSILAMTNMLRESSESQIDLSEKLNNLSREADQVKEILSMIGEIADQTNLLALNAAIEAARAGEHGRGFAVVADEVRKLAERTQRSLDESNATVNVIIQSINDATSSMEKEASKIMQLGERSDGIESSIQESVKAFETITANIQDIAAKTKDNSQRISQMTKEMESINEISMYNARSVEEIAAASEHLSKMTEGLNVKLDVFKI